MTIWLSTPAADGKCSDCGPGPCTGAEQLVITYEWSGTGMKDLDTNTGFLGSSAGWSCGGGGPYLVWDSNDNTGSGPELCHVDVVGAFRDEKWSGSVTISCKAGWYSSAEGSGPATLKVSFRGVEKSKTIHPGQQGGCASTGVATITVSEDWTFHLS